MNTEDDWGLLYGLWGLQICSLSDRDPPSKGRGLEGSQRV